MSYYHYKVFSKKGTIIIPEDVSIKKVMPHWYVKDMCSMQIGRKRFLYYFVFSILYKWFGRKFIEYDVCKGDRIISKAVLISKVPNYEFLPMNGIHICYCETVADERGKGYYPMLLRYILNDNVGKYFYMIVKEHNAASIKGIEKAGFIRYAQGEKLENGHFVITNILD